MVETFARAAAHGTLLTILRGEAAVSFPVLTLAEQGNDWHLIPLAQPPSLALSADVGIADRAALAGRLTLQPVITDTTQLSHPIGRVNDNLLILPMGSAFIRYVP
jgi:hypothetical protein